jgi:hypothetical protein
MNITATDLSLRLSVFYPDAISAGELADYNDVFEFWLAIQAEIRKGADERLDVPSDSFSRQSEILVLYDGRTPIATCCHRYVDLRQRAVLHDSYFDASIWPKSVMARVPGLGQTCVLGSHIFIRPDYRKRTSGLPLKEIVCALSMAHLNGTRPDVLLGMVRVDRGLDKVFQDSGAIALTTDEIWWYHIKVGLIAMFPGRAPLLINPAYREVVTSIGQTCDRFGSNYFARRR